MNRHLLMSKPTHFRITCEINPHMRIDRQPDPIALQSEYNALIAAHSHAGRKVELMPADRACPDMVYTANAGLVHGGHVLLSRLLPERIPETHFHRQWFTNRGYQVIDAPYMFSGQGDALPCGELLLAGHGYRTDRRMHRFLEKQFPYEVVPLRTVSSYWYDLDLAVAVIDRQTVAYCPEALDHRSQIALRTTGLQLIEVDVDEARRFGLNLISDGRVVTMTTGVPRFAERLRQRGLIVIELDTNELRKGGGGIRCTALTLDNGVSPNSYRIATPSNQAFGSPGIMPAQA